MKKALWLIILAVFLSMPSIVNADPRKASPGSIVSPTFVDDSDGQFYYGNSASGTLFVQIIGSTTATNTVDITDVALVDPFYLEIAPSATARITFTSTARSAMLNNESATAALRYCWECSVSATSSRCFASNSVWIGEFFEIDYVEILNISATASNTVTGFSGRQP